MTASTPAWAERIANEWERRGMIGDDEMVARLAALLAEEFGPVVDEMDRLVKKTPFEPTPHGLAIIVPVSQAEDQRRALSQLRGEEA